MSGYFAWWLECSQMGFWEVWCGAKIRGGLCFLELQVTWKHQTGFESILPFSVMGILVEDFKSFQLTQAFLPPGGLPWISYLQLFLGRLCPSIFLWYFDWELGEGLEWPWELMAPMCPVTWIMLRTAPIIYDPFPSVSSEKHLDTQAGSSLNEE